MSTPTFVIAARITPRPGSDRVAPAEYFSGAALRQAAVEAETAGAAFVLLDDELDTAPASGPAAGRLSALQTAAWLGPRTSSVGLVPTLRTTHTEPFLMGTESASLDWATYGRAGVVFAPSLGADAAANVGRRAAPSPEAAWAETADVIDVVRRLWDSWEADAEIRDQTTGRFVDRSKLHYVDFSGTDSAGEEFTVKGPSIVPRPTQGHLPVFVERTADVSLEDLRAAVEHADAVLLPVESVGPETLTVLEWNPSARVFVVIDADSAALDPELVASWVQVGVSGVVLETGPYDVELAIRAAAGVIPELVGTDPAPTEGSTLRERLGLPRAKNRYANA